MPIRVLVNGAHGRMGKVTADTMRTTSGLILAGTSGSQDNLAHVIRESKADVVIDFTSPESVYKNAQVILKAGARPVIGTTGLTTTQIKSLQTLSKKLRMGGIIAPNFSIGMVLLMKYAQEFAKYFHQVEIIEMHHDKKKDSPSGTALFTAEKLANARKTTPPKSTSTHEIIPGSRGASYKGIPIHAVRLPGLMAHEQIIFGDLGETLTLRHDTLDRQCFMRGVVLACKAVIKLHEMVYGLEAIL